ncbi:ATP-grasp domain-containing protein [Desulfolutivibrio sp.]|uniref:ATP-grasp domain-containing protein n=1 Tax=Desulfolutivibrio sp. TaxID=2773296 RepID=UPI002F961DCB
MRLCEHASKLIFATAGIPVPPGILIHPGQAATPPFPPPWYLKSQVAAGGRGKAGGIVRIEKPQELDAAAARLFDLAIAGKKPPFLRLEPAAAIEREMYLSLAVSRARRSLALTAGRRGGMDVERDAGGSHILIQDLRLPGGPSEAQTRSAFFHLGLPYPVWPAFEALVANLYAALTSQGLLLAEINPLVLTTDGTLMALDGKAELDDNAVALLPGADHVAAQENVDPVEALARERGLSLIKLSGFVGLLANGAGLAMATMDRLNFSGFPAANFLDVGGAADAAGLDAALSILFDDPAVQVICINLFGGILSCEKVALALARVLGGRPPQKPIVARLAGNGAAEGLGILHGLALDGLAVVADMDAAMAALAGMCRQGRPAVRPDDAAAQPKSPGFGGTVRPAASRPPLAVPGRGGIPPLAPKDVAAGRRPMRIMVQGVTGKTARLHAGLMAAYGAANAGRVVCGVTPFKGGQHVDGVPVYDSVRQALADHEVDISVIFVPAAHAPDAILEAALAGVPRVACITEGIPQLAMLETLAVLATTSTLLIGPNTPGIIVPGRFKVGIMPVDPFTPGPVAIFSRSGTLTYEAAARLTAAGIGQAVAVGMGGDPFTGLGFLELAEAVRDDPAVSAVLVLGEIGGDAEERLAEYALATAYPKPVAVSVAGVSAPPGRRLGHAGAILENASGAAEKFASLRRAGFTVCPDLADVAPAVARLLAGHPA